MLAGLTGNHSARLGAIWDRLPPSIATLSFIVAILSMLLVAAPTGARWVSQMSSVRYVSSHWLLSKRPTPGTSNEPERALITVNQEPFERPLSSVLNDANCDREEPGLGHVRSI
jgi:hypothetical protein